MPSALHLSAGAGADVEPILPTSFSCKTELPVLVVAF
jgi:hypothetical protein